MCTYTCRTTLIGIHFLKKTKYKKNDQELVKYKMNKLRFMYIIRRKKRFPYVIPRIFLVIWWLTLDLLQCLTM